MFGAELLEQVVGWCDEVAAVGVCSPLVGDVDVAVVVDVL